MKTVQSNLVRLMLYYIYFYRLEDCSILVLMITKNTYSVLNELPFAQLALIIEWEGNVDKPSPWIAMCCRKEVELVSLICKMESPTTKGQW